MQTDAVVVGIAGHRAVDGGAEEAPSGGPDIAQLVELADALQAVDGLLLGLGGEAVHQIGMHQDAGAGQGAAGARGLLDADPLVHQLQQPVRGGLEAALDQCLRQGSEELGWCRLVDEVKARATRLRGNLPHTFDDPLDRCRAVAADIVQAGVAGGALLPVATVRQGEGIPVHIHLQPGIDIRSRIIGKYRSRGKDLVGGGADEGLGDIRQVVPDLVPAPAVLADLGLVQADKDSRPSR